MHNKSLKYAKENAKYTTKIIATTNNANQ